MANIALSQDNYVDYVASLYLHACSVEDVKFSLKPLTKEGFEDVVLVHIEGVQRSTGTIVNIDLWPRNLATEDDLKDLPKSLDDIHFRVGYHTYKDLDTGETVTLEGKPKWIALINDGKKTVFTGEKREYQG